MSTSHSLKPSDREMIATVAEDLADDVFIDEAARQKNKETIDKYIEEIKELDERLEKIEATSVTKTEQQATEREIRAKRNRIIDIVKDLSAKNSWMNSKQRIRLQRKQKNRKHKMRLKYQQLKLKNCNLRR